MPSWADEKLFTWLIPREAGRQPKELFGLDWSGTLVHDGWSVYDDFAHAAHQQCLWHSLQLPLPATVGDGRVRGGAPATRRAGAD